jgi:diguanylate cyclase (GGDEF)-like protein
VNSLDLPALHALMQDNERLRARIAQLESLSATDSLTGAWNRAQLAGMVEVEMSRAMRSGQPVTLILLDIDHFKRVNDVHGHLAGDAVLTEIVARIRKRMRNTDSLFRWGGDEFVVLATSVGYRDGAALADGLRRTIAAAPFAEVWPITASLGVTEYKEGESAESWFRRTDEALYEAKTAGRNRIHVDRQGSSDRHPNAAGTDMSLFSRSEGAGYPDASSRWAMRLWASTWGPRSRVVS